MMPIGPLMIEHRLIERMIRVVAEREGALGRYPEDDIRFIDAAVDFIRVYADRCHHGKEEDILFRDLAAKPISDEHRRIIAELIEEHRQGRETVARLLAARNRYAAGDASAAEDAEKELHWLVTFYPRHIEKEDRHFFIPVMGYFSKDEKDAMLREEYEFDRKLIHEKYLHVVEGFEAR